MREDKIDKLRYKLLGDTKKYKFVHKPEKTLNL
jgi:hypothetical protein